MALWYYNRRWPRAGFQFLAIGAWLVCCGGAIVSSALAADPAAGTPAVKEPPADRVVEFTTSDGVRLKASYYPPTNGRESAVVVLLHGYQGNRTECHRFAKQLQRDWGHAVLAPDLRAHGDSTQMAGSRVPLSPQRLRAQDVRSMIRYDLEEVRRFLVARHNDEELNLNRLCLVGAGMGAVVAINWADFDWSVPALPTAQQNRFVKALVLISPEYNFRGVQIQEALQHPALQTELSLLVMCGGEDPTAVKTTRRIFGQIEPHRPREKQLDDVNQRTLFQFEAQTKLQGSPLLAEMTDAQDLVIDFVRLRLVERDLPWKNLKKPTD